MKKNPELLTILNPASRPGLKKAIAKYREFHGSDPVEITRRGKESKNPKILIVLGRLVEVIYEPRTGHRKRVQWFHEFGQDARLATDASGKRLYIVSREGKVQVDFSRGIVS